MTQTFHKQTPRGDDFRMPGEYEAPCRLLDAVARAG